MLKKNNLKISINIQMNCKNKKVRFKKKANLILNSYKKRFQRYLQKIKYFL